MESSHSHQTYPRAECQLINRTEHCPTDGEDISGTTPVTFPNTLVICPQSVSMVPPGGFHWVSDCKTHHWHIFLRLVYFLKSILTFFLKRKITTLGS